jgi:CRISPR-associated protein Cmr4
MYKSTNPLFLICETPLHAGSGDDLGIVDLPIQRERHTSFPKIEASSFKGAIREAFESKVNSKKFEKWEDDDVKIHRVFGFDDGSLKETKEQLKKIFRYKPNKDKDEEKEGNDFSGCVAFTDARLLLFPVKSMKGVFVWVTCPQVLNRLASDLKIANKTPFASLEKVKAVEPKEGTVIVSDKAKVTFGDSVILEEYAFSASQDPNVSTFATELADVIFKGDDLQYWNSTLKSNLVVLNNNDFRDFVNQSTEVITRTKIDNESGTVADGALFTEEYLPNDSVMYTLVMFSDEYNKRDSEKMKANQVQSFFSQKLNDIKMFQLGGNATLGKGLLRTQLID